MQNYSNVFHQVNKCDIGKMFVLAQILDVWGGSVNSVSKSDRSAPNSIGSTTQV